MRSSWLLVTIVSLGCAAARPAPHGVPQGSGWVCGTRGDGTSFCVRRDDDCAVAAMACSRRDLAHCFTYRANDGTTQFSCKPTPAECDAQADRFARDEHDVSRCEPRP